MRNILKSIFNSVIITSIILVSFGSSFAQETKAVSKETSKPFTQIFAFGDSYSDNGEAKRISTEIVNSKDKPKEAFIKPSDSLYYNSRYSNGLTAVEVLASKLDVKLTNYATGGATTGKENYSTWMDHLGGSGILGQIDRFEKSLDSKKADPDALYFIFASANDYFTFMDYSKPGKVEDVANQAVINVNLAISKLSNLGAKKFFVVNSSDLTLVPYEITCKRTESAKNYTTTFNTFLPKSLDSLKSNLNVSIMLFDLPSVSNQIVKTPSSFGIKVLDKECQSTYPEVKPAKSNPDSYYFWDEWHYTKAVHSIIGEEMYKKALLFK